MPTTVIKYPLDLTGRSADNLVIAEPHGPAVNGNRAFVPSYGPFFTRSLVVRNRATGTALTPKVHYNAAQLFEDATLKTGQEICSVIVMTDAGLGIEVEIDYQVLGGDYSSSITAIQEMIAALDLDARPVHWGSLLGKPVQFPPAPHLHDLGDVYGFEYVVAALEALRQAILMGDSAAHDELLQYVDYQDGQLSTRIANLLNDLSSHVTNFSNPHQVTKAQVGLGNVQNFRLATDAEAAAGVSNSFYMTPHLAKMLLDTHALRTDNPHNVTKAQVGLSLVANYSVASLQQALDGIANDKYLTPFLAKAMIDKAIGEIPEPEVPDTPPEARFTYTGATTVPSTSDHQITFLDQSNAGNSAIQTWVWSFGDSTTYNGKTPPVHTYANPGTYVVSLTVTDANGLSHTTNLTLHLTVTVVNDPPTANFTRSGNTTVTDPNNPTLTFNSTSTEGSSNIKRAVWDFGDGEGATQNVSNEAGIEPVTHTYAMGVGTIVRTVKLTVTDANGLSSTKSMNITLTKSAAAVPPTANFGYTGSVNVVDPDNPVITFTNTSEPGSSSIIDETWDFGDGSGYVANIAGSHEAPGPHTYTIPLGSTTRVVRLTVTDSNGLSDTKTVTLVLSKSAPAVNPPSAGFTWNGNTTVIEGTNHVISVQDTSVPGSAAITSWAWTWGDGATSSGKTPPAHTYNVPAGSSAEFTITLKVTDANGKTSTSSGIITLTKTASAAPTANFTTAGSLTVQEGNNHVISVSDTSTPGDVAITSWLWNWGDGTSSTGKTPAAHTYNTPVGTTPYSIKLTVTDANGKTSTKTKTISLVKTPLDPPTANFTTSGATTVNEGTDHVISVTDSSIAGDGTITSWVWNWGDGSASVSGKTPSAHTYNVAVGATKSFVIKLTVKDVNNKTSTKSITVTLTKNAVNSPSASFSNSGATTVMEPNNPVITFTDTSTPGSGTINSWSWSFGDGTTSTAKNPPAHTYTMSNGQTKTVTITLTVTDSNGKSSTYSKSLTLKRNALVPPTANFTMGGAQTSTYPTNPKVDVTDTSTPGSGTIVSWLWTWGDGTQSTGQNPAVKTYAINVGSATFTITLKVTDENGKTDSVSKTVTVTKNAPTISPLTNLGFESGDTKWSKTGNMTIGTSASAHGGSYRARCTYNNGNASGLLAQGGNPVSPGQYVGVACYVKPSGASDEVGGKIRLIWLDIYGNAVPGSGGSVVGNDIAVYQGATWRLSHVYAPAPAGAAYYTVQGEAYIVRSGGVVEFDDFTTNYVPATGGGGDGGGCVAVEMYLTEELQALQASEGDWVDGVSYNPDDTERRQVRYNKIMPQPTLRMVTESGIALIASTTTPFTLYDGSSKFMPDMLGELVLVDDDGEIRWEEVTVLEDAGVREVAFIDIQDHSFFAGVTAKRRIASHNAIKGPGGCVVVDSIMFDGDVAGNYTAGRELLVTDPFEESANTTSGQVVFGRPVLQPCVRITTANGTMLECSTTAPIPVQTGGFVSAPQLLGLYIPTTQLENINAEQTAFEWDEVVSVEDIGPKMVQHLYVENRCFWASADGKRFVLHHNAKDTDPMGGL